MQIQPCGPLHGEITVPGDKSISHRAVMLGALANGTTHITGFLMGEDCLSTIDCFRKMGVSIDVSDKEVVVEGVGLHGLTAPECELYTGNSGTTTRLLSGILAGQSFTSTMNGDATIQRRPMGRVMKPLREMGASIEGKDDNFCPLTMHPSELHGIEYRLPVASAQLKSAILLAGLYAEGQTTVIEPAPSRDHTERMFRALGVEIETNGNVITLNPPEDLHAVDIAVPSDISSAAYFLVAGAIVPGSELTIKNVGVNPTRTGIIDVLRDMGADIRWEGEELVARTSKLHGLHADCSQIPDVVPALAVAMAAVSFAAMLGVGLFFESGYSAGLLLKCLFAAVMGLVSVVIAVGSLPFWEATFEANTPLRLLELTNPNNELLRRLMIEAPGTYHHSLIVANLAESLFWISSV